MFFFCCHTKCKDSSMEAGTRRRQKDPSWLEGLPEKKPLKSSKLNLKPVHGKLTGSPMWPIFVVKISNFEAPSFPEIGCCMPVR